MFRGELFEYQIQDCVTLSSNNCMLNALSCGLGKTVEMIAVCEFLTEHSKSDRVLIFCRHPDEWKNQIATFTDSTCLVYAGTPAQRKALRETTAKYIVSSYGLALQESDAIYFRSLCKDTTILIADEAHKIKSRTSRRAKALQGFSHLCGRRYALSATPVWNRLDDLFGLMQWIDKGVLGSWTEFSERYLIKSYHKIIGYKNLDELRSVIKPYIIRRTPDSVKGQLPSITYRTVPIVPVGDHHKMLLKISDFIYDTLEGFVQDGLWRWGGSINDKNVLGLLTYLDRLSISPTNASQYITADTLPGFHKYKPTNTKIDEAVSIIADLRANRENCIVFCRYLDGAEILHKTIYGSLLLTGKAAGKHKDYVGTVVDKYNALCDKGGAVLISSDVGGESLNLPEARYIINVDVPWGSSDLIQRASRGRRATSKHSESIIIQLLIPGFDEYKMALCRWKGVFADFVIDKKDTDAVRPMLKDYKYTGKFHD